MDATAERERIMHRLRQHYATRTPLPVPLVHQAGCARWNDDAPLPCVCQAPLLMLDRLQRLMRGVVAEFEEPKR